MRVGSVVPLGDLMDTAAAVLDALEAAGIMPAPV
jgi:hypothetical protein